MERKGKICVDLPNHYDLIDELKKDIEIIDLKNQEITYGPRSDKYWYLQTGIDLEIDF